MRAVLRLLLRNQVATLDHRRCLTHVARPLCVGCTPQALIDMAKQSGCYDELIEAMQSEQ